MLRRDTRIERSSTAQQLGGEREHDRARDHAPDRAYATDNDEDNEAQHRIDIEVRVVDDLLRIRKQRSNQGVYRAGGHESNGLDAKRIYPSGRGHSVRLADGIAHEA